MELSSDRAVASLEMSQTQSQEDGAFISDGESYESLPPHVSVTTHMTAGAVAGVLEHSVMYPVDSVKVTHPLKQTRGSSRGFLPTQQHRHANDPRSTTDGVCANTASWEIFLILTSLCLC